MRLTFLYLHSTESYDATLFSEFHIGTRYDAHPSRNIPIIFCNVTLHKCQAQIIEAQTSVRKVVVFSA